MYDICHPSYYHIGKLGCTDPVKISTTFYVYIELCEARQYWDVNYKYNESVDLLYLEVKKKKNSETELYVPWPTLYNISLNKIEEIQEGLNSDKITFVFKSEDSTSIIYKVTKGLVKPTSPEVTKLMKEKEEKKLDLEKEIRKNTSNLYELAKSLNSDNTDKETETDVDKADEKG
ncbi:tRNA-splicing endonuclease subunit Sen15 [Halictus rubicundus]|uniref:tRNA-splicing endonuclease subunit Sen15 n=1 Tax=Halictus rubicundus TaxID=77578 RepID=UPI004035AAA6